MPSGPYLPTSASYLKESSLLLQAYPNSTRIVTKYTYPKPSTSPKTQQQSTPSDEKDAPPKTPLAILTMKTYTPEAGICLKYRTNKAAEVGRLITALGLLAGGADLGSLDSGGVTGAVEAAEATGTGTEAGAGSPALGAGVSAGTSSAGISKGGKGKGKKKGKK
ncbi:signal recognition particle 9 kDa protein-domain-containing protein [Aspergillus karnatakaensis]|uniref:SRP9/SRP21 family protein n=1 Tax=Aspergillus karnatakaensis TaxID=1810916 RepID=UPI003CCD9794